MDVWNMINPDVIQNLKSSQENRLVNITETMEIYSFSVSFIPC